MRTSSGLRCRAARKCTATNTKIGTHNILGADVRPTSNIQQHLSQIPQFSPPPMIHWTKTLFHYYSVSNKNPGADLVLQLRVHVRVRLEEVRHAVVVVRDVRQHVWRGVRREHSALLRAVVRLVTATDLDPPLQLLDVLLQAKRGIVRRGIRSGRDLEVPLLIQQYTNLGCTRRASCVAGDQSWRTLNSDKWLSRDPYYQNTSEDRHCAVTAAALDEAPTIASISASAAALSPTSIIFSHLISFVAPSIKMLHSCTSPRSESYSLQKKNPTQRPATLHLMHPLSA